MLKTCIDCKKKQVLNNFHKGKKDCKFCRSQKRKQYYIENKEKENKISKKYYYENKEYFKAYNKIYRQFNKVRLKQYRYNHKDQISRTSKKWRNHNLFKLSEYSAKRRAAKLQQTPKWLTKKHRKQMQEIYFERDKLNSKAGYTKYHVDHIIPLQGKECRGLHVPWNLQIILASLNRIKCNKTQ